MTLRFAFGCAVLAATAVTSHAAPARTPAPRIEKLQNGIHLILAHDPAAAGVDVTVWYRTGAANEAPGRTGLTHAVEQLMFAKPDGAARDHLAAVLDEGGMAGTHSTHDFTSFWQTIPPEALEGVLALEAARMRALPGTAADFEAARERIRLNRERVGQTPVVLGLTRLYDTAFQGDAYAWPTVGREQDLGALTWEALAAWHRERYGPSNAVVSITGRFDARDARKWVRATLGRVPAREAAPASAALAAQTEPRRATFAYDFVAPAAFIGWRVDGLGGRDLAALDVAARMLAGSPMSLVQQRLVATERSAAFVQGGLELRQRAGLLHVTAVLPPGSDTSAVRRVEEAILAEAARVIEGADARAFDAAKREADLQYQSGRQRVRDRAMSLGVAYLSKGDPAADRGAAIAGLTLDTVREAARRALVPERMTVVWMLAPGGAGEGVAR